MLFFLHLLGLLYGLGGLVWTKLMTSPGDVILPGSFMRCVVGLYPPKLFSPTWDKENGDEAAADGAKTRADGTKPYLISGAISLYCGRYLFTRCCRG